MVLMRSVNLETAFRMEFSRQDRNDITQDGEINGKINGKINDKMQNGISDAQEPFPDWWRH